MERHGLYECKEKIDASWDEMDLAGFRGLVARSRTAI